MDLFESVVTRDELLQAINSFPRAGQHNLCSTANIEECRAYISKVLDWSNMVRLPLIDLIDAKK